MRMICLDLEGVLIPEIWDAVAVRTGIAALGQTTRDVPDYDELMEQRIEILRNHAIGLTELRTIVEGMEPLPGARTFLDRLRGSHQVTVLSDTFYELADPLFAALGRPSVFCHHLEVADDGGVTGWRKRTADHKRRAVEGFTALGFDVMAAGDSYNDLAMLDAARRGFLFRAPQWIRADRSDLPALSEYAELLAASAAEETAAGP